MKSNHKKTLGPYAVALHKIQSGKIDSSVVVVVVVHSKKRRLETLVLGTKSSRVLAHFPYGAQEVHELGVLHVGVNLHP